MSTRLDSLLREQLVERRQRLAHTLEEAGDSTQLLNLLHEVDAALGRMDRGTYGLCETCHDTIEADRLLANPLVQYCLDHLTSEQRADLQHDLDLASRIQTGLLPKPDFEAQGWKAAYHYEAAGAVSGDYCDLINADDGSVYFMLGDVSGKGVSASMLMTHLHAMFRTLISLGLPLNQVMERASRVFCESTLPTHFATLVSGRATKWGEVELCNAGHMPPLLVQGGSVRNVEGAGLPVGIFCDEDFSVNRIHFAPGDTLVLYTDGISEAENEEGVQYGTDRLFELIKCHGAYAPEALIKECIREIRAFRKGAPKRDDLTMLAISRTEATPA